MMRFRISWTIYRYDICVTSVTFNFRTTTIVDDNDDGEGISPLSSYLSIEEIKKGAVMHVK